jgi:hypothetical protein
MARTCEAHSPRCGHAAGRWRWRSLWLAAWAAPRPSDERRSDRRPRSRSAPGPGPQPRRSSISPRHRWASGIVGAVRVPLASTARGSSSGPGAWPECACPGRPTRSPPSCQRCPSTKCAPATSCGGPGMWASTPGAAGWSKRSTGATESSVARRRGRIERFAPPAETRGARVRLADRANSETRLAVSRGGHTVCKVCKGSAQASARASAQASPQGSPQGQSAGPAKTW